MDSINIQDNFTIEDAKCAVMDILNALRMPDKLMRLEDAREDAGNDMLKIMQLVFPLAMHIQSTVIGKYGFSSDGDGVVKFTQIVKRYEKQDNELSSLNQELFTLIIPQISSSENSI